MTNEDIVKLTPQQLALHPAIIKLGESIRWRNATLHDDDCDHDGMNTCPCGAADIYYAMQDVGIKP